MSPIPVRLSAEGIDLSPRVFRTATVAASPAAASETTVASVTVSGDLTIGLGILLLGYVAFTVGTSGVSANVRIRQTNTSGTVIKASGATTVAATNLKAASTVGFDTAATLPGQVYVLTLTVGSGAAESTVSAVTLVALVL